MEQQVNYNTYGDTYLGTMYAISFDLNTELLAKAYPGPSYNNAYFEIGKLLEELGFEHTQGSMYMSKADRVNVVRCFTAVAQLTKKFAWFAPSIRDIRMLRIEENNDLKPIVEQFTVRD